MRALQVYVDLVGHPLQLARAAVREAEAPRGVDLVPAQADVRVEGEEAAAAAQPRGSSGLRGERCHGAAASRAAGCTEPPCFHLPANSCKGPAPPHQ
eukprot:CAMPEP_0197882612 /NCGR_PEP_ID=MMETSP1439-20131203/9701_1 /TAXON_ID=66791 /ORGANISM="Gonyaulax spinifera, Strain CCMP409" /LENGTH=96 /DNA_ID=CAMNT_0043502277 /DNA_START=443 /DNA_END=733 /DNA_ORIENTATION=-